MEQYKIVLEVIFDDERTINDIAISANTEVFGGKVSRVDFEGHTFSDLDWFYSLFNDEQVGFLCARENIHERMCSAIFKAFENLIEEIEDEEELTYDDDIPY
ncbi:MAG: hypothetical protein SOW21_04310 [[Actinobacillus] rossii]|uniref:Uncharacterized protein n=1 Tax=[Actinobacillus] rossii TaxID=123820 RepID=A0A380TSV6_9PAST|nr:hypothetical protein [[Actinobacillus] rossii]SUT91473.1 Uncharacterised protein [[Actinobacillus] rossii]SUT94230.1 Uncharacterised protein [[Actinobacillus] rossii]